MSSIQRWTQIIALLTASVITGTEAGAQLKPPTQEQKEEAAATLKITEKNLTVEQQEFQNAQELVQNLTASIAALKKGLETSAKDTETTSKASEKMLAAARLTPSTSDDEAAKKFQEQAQAMQAQLKHMQETLAELEKLKKEADEANLREEKDVKRIQRELVSVLENYFEKADPRMIAQRGRVLFDAGDIAFDMPSNFQRFVRSGDSKTWLQHFGLGAEHTWQDVFHLHLGNECRGDFVLPGVAMHPEVTTAVMDMTADRLIQAKVPGANAPVGRLGMTFYLQEKAPKRQEVHQGIIGHPVDAYRPSVVNNSTSNLRMMPNDGDFHSMMVLFTQSLPSATFKTTREFDDPNGIMTYGLPPMGRPIIVSAAGNDGGEMPTEANFTKNFVPYHMNILATRIPSKPDVFQRDDTAASVLDDYNSIRFSTAHAAIERPRWNADGSALALQYLNPEYRSMIASAVWKMAGYDHVPSQEDLDDTKKYPPKTVEAVEKDIAGLILLVAEREKTNKDGILTDLRGTSFASPTAAGVMLAAKIMFPDATEAELVDAFCSSCKPITRRALEEKDGKTADDIMYYVNDGKHFSIVTGFGEFVLNGPEKGPDRNSWVLMQERLEAMQKKKQELTGHGEKEVWVKNSRGEDVGLHGQPEHTTLRVQKMEEEDISPKKKRQREKMHKTLMQAYDDLMIGMAPDDELRKMFDDGKYPQALNVLEANYIYCPAPAFPKEHPDYKKLEEMVGKLERSEEHTYRFTVQDNQDACCTLTALRLKFRDGGVDDKHIVLESPSGTRLPVRLSVIMEGTANTSTPGFMRESTAGTWKLYTRHALAEGSELILMGTERDKKRGILDVRELVLPAIEKKEAQHHGVPADHVEKPIRNPHATLRHLDDKKRPKFVSGEKKSSAASMSHEYREYLQQWLENTELKKAGALKPEHITPEGNKTSSLSHQWGSDMVALTSQLMGQLAAARRDLVDDVIGYAGEMGRIAAQNRMAGDSFHIGEGYALHTGKAGGRKGKGTSFREQINERAQRVAARQDEKPSRSV